MRMPSACSGKGPPPVRSGVGTGFPKKDMRHSFNIFPERIPAFAGCAALALVLLATILVPQPAQEPLRDNALDIVLRIDQALHPLEQSELPVVVVDIDRRSIEALGPWPWP